MTETKEDKESLGSRFSQYYTMTFNHLLFSDKLRWMVFLMMIALFLERMGVSRIIMGSFVGGFLLCFFLGVWRKWYKE